MHPSPQFVVIQQAAIVLVALMLLPDVARAQPREGHPDEGPVFVDPAAVDEDYRFQGEYLGWQAFGRWGRETRPAGLQVIALGHGRFAATGYLGGLPGEGWSGGERRLFEGTRDGDAVRLEGEQGRLEVDGTAARLLGDDGTKVGEYHKVQRVSPTIGALPPRGAVVLFDGSDTGHLVGAAVTADGLLQSGAQTAAALGDMQLHAEFRLPYKPLARGQDRGNSGLYLQSRYEVQILDSFGLEGVENECGALYRTRRPDINMCYPPLVWQTYDIDFRAPRFDEQGNKISDMRISVWHNGVPVHSAAAISNKTGAGQPEGPQPLPMKIQDHRNPVMFRNLWLIERPASSPAAEAAMASK